MNQPKKTKTLEKAYLFGKWHFDPSDGQLTSKQLSVRLQPRLAKLLSIFVSNPNKILSREVLIEHLWDNKTVNEDALSRCIAELRTHLGDKTKTPIYIETVPKKGYRFIATLSSPSTHKPLLISALFSVLVITAVYFYLSVPAKVDLHFLQNQLLQAKRLTTDLDLERQPELSPSGDKIAFSVLLQGKLAVKIISTSGKLIQLIQDEVKHLSSPVFSPDEKHLIMASTLNNQCDIILYSLQQQSKENIGKCRKPNASGLFDWSPNGKQLAYVALAKDSKQTAIWQYDFETKISTQLSQPINKKDFDTKPKYSSSANYLSFLRGTASVRNIFTLALDSTNNVKQITEEKSFIAGSSWFKEDEAIIYDSDVNGERNLWLYDFKTKQNTLLGARDSQYPSINKLNSQMIFQELRYNANIWSLNLTASHSQPKQTIQSIKYNNFPEYSPDGKQIAFITNRAGHSELWLYTIATQKQQKILSIAATHLFMPNWSSNGENILVSSRSKAGYFCYSYNLKSSIYKNISPTQAQYTNCSYNSQDEIYAISKELAAENRLITISQTNKLNYLNLNSINRFRLTNDDALVFTKRDKNGIYAANASGLNEKVIIADFKQSYNGYWTTQGQYLYYAKMGDQDKNTKTAIWRRNLLTNEEFFVTEHLPSAIGNNLAINPEHSELSFSQTDSRKADIYITKLMPDE